MTDEYKQTEPSPKTDELAALNDVLLQFKDAAPSLCVNCGQRWAYFGSDRGWCLTCEENERGRYLTQSPRG